jgi:DNA-binding transcriptional ArsR family regulator
LSQVLGDPLVRAELRALLQLIKLGLECLEELLAPQQAAVGRHLGPVILGEYDHVRHRNLTDAIAVHELYRGLYPDIEPAQNKVVQELCDFFFLKNEILFFAIRVTVSGEHNEDRQVSKLGCFFGCFEIIDPFELFLSPGR